MAKLKAAARNKLPKSDFGLPGSRKYPMPDKAHARNAKARASQQEAKGNLSASAKARIDAMADRKLGKHKSEKKHERKEHEGKRHEKKAEKSEKREHHTRRHHEPRADHPTANQHFDAMHGAFKRASVKMED